MTDKPKPAEAPKRKQPPQPSDEGHPLHHEPGRPGRGDPEPRGIGKPIGQPDDFGRI